MWKNEHTAGRWQTGVLVFCALVLFASCCTNPPPVVPVIDEIEAQQAASQVIVERIEVETIKIVKELEVINAPPEIIERVQTVYRDTVELKASLAKERRLTADLKIRVETLAFDKKQLETSVNRIKAQRNAGIIAAGILAALLFLAFKLK